MPPAYVLCDRADERLAYLHYLDTTRVNHASLFADMSQQVEGRRDRSGGYAAGRWCFINSVWGGGALSNCVVRNMTDRTEVHERAAGRKRPAAFHLPGISTPSSVFKIWEPDRDKKNTHGGPSH